MIDGVVKKYNRMSHTTIGLSPNQAINSSNEMFVRYNLFDKAQTGRKWPPLAVGDKVRIKLIKKTPPRDTTPSAAPTSLKYSRSRTGSIP